MPVECQIIPPAEHLKYDLIEPDVPEFAPRTISYSLVPMAPGTSQAEGQTSYVMRLAHEHAVTVETLVAELLAKLPCIEGGVGRLLGDTPNRTGRGFVACDYAINGLVPRVELWLTALEVLTGQRDLSALTLFQFRNVLTHNLFKPIRHWCPLCFQEWRTAGQRIYEPLIWGLQDAPLCPTHGVPLRSTCATCGRTLRPLAAHSRPGVCSSCDSWLGAAGLHENITAEEGHVRDEERWCTRQIAELLEGRFTAGPVTMRSWFGRHLAMYIDHAFDRNIARFARHLGISFGVAQAWRSGKVTIHIRNLLRICKALAVPARSIFEGPEPTAENLDAATRAVKDAVRISPKPRRTSDEIRCALKAALSRTVPPGPYEIAREMGYTSVAMLVSADKGLYRQIRRRYVESGRSHWWLKNKSKGKCAPEHIQAALEASLAGIEPISVREIATRLGYATTTPIRAMFPALCAQISAKCAQSEMACHEQVRSALLAAAEACSPIALIEIAHQFGHSSCKPLERLEPALCRRVDAHVHRLAENRAVEFERQVKAAVIEEPPPSWAQVCRRLSTTSCTLKGKYPELQREIAQRYRQFLTDNAVRRYELAQRAVLEIVADCMRCGVEPTYKVVVRQLPQDASRGIYLIKDLIATSKTTLNSN